MLIQFKNEYLEELAKGIIKGKPKYSSEVIIMFKKKIKILNAAKSTVDLRNLKSLHYEELKGDKTGLCSIRVNDKYRLEFTVVKDVIIVREIIVIHTLSNHYK